MREKRGGSGRIICIGSPTASAATSWSDQLRAAKVGHRRHGAHVGARTAPAGNHRQCGHPRRRDREMTRPCPNFAAAVEADSAGEPMPAFFRHDLGFGTSDDVSGLVAYLASARPPQCRVRRSASAATGCRCGRTRARHHGVSRRRLVVRGARCRVRPGHRPRPAVGGARPSRRSRRNCSV